MMHTKFHTQTTPVRSFADDCPADPSPSVCQRAQEILASEAAAISSVEVTESFADAVTTLQTCSGKVLTTGMGKAGLIARKFAATLCSTGTPATFLHPAEAAHGDLGVIGPGDSLVAFSVSGQTSEVIETIQRGRQLGLETVIGITSHPDSRLRTLCDTVIDMGVIEEPCPLGLTPTAGIAVMLAISDALALVLMEQKSFSESDFGARHHGGYLGEKTRSSGTATVSRGNNHSTAKQTEN